LNKLYTLHITICILHINVVDIFQREDEVCYASLNTLSMLKKKRLQSSDFTTYTEVRTKRT